MLNKEITYQIGQEVELVRRPSVFASRYFFERDPIGYQTVIVFALGDGVAYAIENNPEEAKKELETYGGCFWLKSKDEVYGWSWGVTPSWVRETALRWYEEKWGEKWTGWIEDWNKTAYMTGKSRKPYTKKNKHKG